MRIGEAGQRKVFKKSFNILVWDSWAGGHLKSTFSNGQNEGPTWRIKAHAMHFWEIFNPDPEHRLNCSQTATREQGPRKRAKMHQQLDFGQVFGSGCSKPRCWSIIVKSFLKPSSRMTVLKQLLSMLRPRLNISVGVHCISFDISWWASAVTIWGLDTNITLSGGPKQSCWYLILKSFLGASSRLFLGIWVSISSACIVSHLIFHVGLRVWPYEV